MPTIVYIPLIPSEPTITTKTVDYGQLMRDTLDAWWRNFYVHNQDN